MSGATEQESKADESKERALITAADGVGPLLEREYVAEVEGAGCEAEGVGRRLRSQFEKYAPPETATFRREQRSHEVLELGDELDINLALLGHCRVRVVHFDGRSVTLRTLEGHPEAGRITFGAAPGESGRLVLAIRSRTRASGLIAYAGYQVMGKQMQSRCWIRFLDNLASDCGGRVVDAIHVRTRKVDDQEGAGDREPTPEPTFTDAAEVLRTALATGPEAEHREDEGDDRGQQES